MILNRLVQISDAPQLLHLNDLFNGEGSNTLAAIEDSIRSNSQEIVCIAADGDKLVGFCCGQIFKSMCYNVNYGEITELYVLETYRRKGTARGLMQFMEAEFRSQGIDNFQLFTGKNNEAAQAFYKALGYTETAEMMFRKRVRKSE